MKTKCLSLFLILSLILSVFSAASAQNIAFEDGDGTKEDPYRIHTAAQLIYLAEQVNAGNTTLSGAHYLLTADLRLDGTDFSPIGLRPGTPFRGTFDGGGHILYGLSYDNEELRQSVSQAYLTGDGSWEEVYMGLFGVLEGGTVQNLTVAGRVSGPVVGGLVGWNRGGTIANCTVNCTPQPWMTPRSCFGGGIVGINSGTVRNCCYGGGLTGSLVGRDEKGTVVNSFSLGTFYDVLPNHSGDALLIDGDGVTAARLERPDMGEPYEEEAMTTLWSEGLNGWAEPLNAWAETQGDNTHRWLKLPGAYPMAGDHVIQITLETGDYLPFGETDGFTPVQDEAIGGQILSPYAFSAGLSGLRPTLLPVRDGVSRTLFLQPYEGYQISSVLIDGVDVGAVESCTLPTVSEDHTVLVRFVREGSMENFIPAVSYDGYSDVDENAWYGTQQEGVIRTATQLGLFAGVGEGRFAPQASITLGEVVKLAAVIRDTYRGEGYPFDQSAGDHWYDTYYDYAVALGIILPGEFDDLSRPATRMEMAHIFYRALPGVEYEMVSHLLPPDLTGSEACYFDVTCLYQAGILKGSDSAGTFRGDTTITRAEAAAIAVRAALPNLRMPVRS